MTAVLLAFNGDLVERAAMGMRLEVYSCLLAGLAWLMLVGRGMLSRGRIFAFSVLSAILLLTNLSSLLFLVLMFCYGFAARRWSWRSGAVGAGMVLIITCPFFLRQAARFGSPLYVVNRHATWYRNQILLRRGDWRRYPPAAMPDVAAVAENGYTGPPCSALDLFFRLHNFRELIVLTVRGYWRMFGEGWLLAPMPLWVVLAPVGIVATLLGRRRAILLALLGALPPYVGFLVGYDVLPRRLALQGHVFLAFCTAEGLRVLLEWETRGVDRPFGFPRGA